MDGKTVKFQEVNPIEQDLLPEILLFCDVNHVLAKYGNIPVSAGALTLDYPEIRKTGQKLALLEANGDIIRLKRGLYVCSDKIIGIPFSLELIANRLLTPSYVSMSTALRYYGQYRKLFMRFNP